MQCTPAGGLRYHDKTTTHLVVEAGGTWSRYAPGDFGQVYPVTLQRGPEGQTTMRWTIPPYVPSQERTD
ncbi:hypothetical protein OHA79_05425 [Streptomyces sp. NBC_00841]|uniref:hypothetical protein n=1 Tax=unclassified Streptomyces TaxID=2593676 RepID=UPI00225A6929|nr:MULTISPECIES: hypothetical protein [unclassified Streptomyces]MCX4537412.1 hypothetical protein [Streptomyces sp. NBC_01669]WRZ97363.1 hypothetical protein OHA79_05425 [Streptomyces sp. NBC_00841]